MAIRGRKPASIADKKLRGNPGNRHLVPAIPEGAPEGDMVIPPNVAKNPVALAYWHHYLATTAPGHLLPVDAPALGMLCMALSRLAEAEDRMNGLVVRLMAPGQGQEETPRGAIIQSPYLPIINRQTVISAKLQTDLGLTPVERNRLGIGSNGNRRAGAPADPAEKYFN